MRRQPLNFHLLDRPVRQREDLYEAALQCWRNAETAWHLAPSPTPLVSLVVCKRLTWSNPGAYGSAFSFRFLALA